MPRCRGGTSSSGCDGGTTRGVKRCQNDEKPQKGQRQWSVCRQCQPLCHGGHGGGHGGGSYSRSGSSNRLAAAEVAAVVTVLKSLWSPFCQQAPRSPPSWETRIVLQLFPRVKPKCPFLHCPLALMDSFITIHWGPTMALGKNQKVVTSFKKATVQRGRACAHVGGGIWDAYAVVHGILSVWYTATLSGWLSFLHGWFWSSYHGEGRGQWLRATARSQSWLCGTVNKSLKLCLSFFN